MWVEQNEHLQYKCTACDIGRQLQVWLCTHLLYYSVPLFAFQKMLVKKQTINIHDSTNVCGNGSQLHGFQKTDMVSETSGD